MKLMSNSREHTHHYINVLKIKDLKCIGVDLVYCYKVRKQDSVVEIIDITGLIFLLFHCQKIIPIFGLLLTS